MAAGAGLALAALLVEHRLRQRKKARSQAATPKKFFAVPRAGVVAHMQSSMAPGAGKSAGQTSDCSCGHRQRCIGEDSGARGEAE